MSVVKYGTAFFIGLFMWMFLCLTMAYIGGLPDKMWPLVLWTGATFFLGVAYGLWVASVHLVAQ